MRFPTPTDDKPIRRVSTITHDGKILVFGVDPAGTIWYTVRQDGFENNADSTQTPGWENWQRLSLPDEAQDDASVVAYEQAELSTNDGTPMVRSRYRTAGLSADAPVQLVSGLGHLYVFRQSQEGTLLADRFVLDGLANALVPKLEVRFKRSRQKYEPKRSAKPGAEEVDALDFRDIAGKAFYEPSTELLLAGKVEEGRFAVALTPTIEQDRFRWQIFVVRDGAVELISVRASEAGLFDVKDATILEAAPLAPETLVPRSIPGIVRRVITIPGTITGAPAVTRYDSQQERQTESGELALLRTYARLMLLVPTDQGTAALGFTVTADGQLSPISDEPVAETMLRDRPRRVLLPVNTLDDIKAFGQAPQLNGTIKGIRRDARDNLTILSARTNGLKPGDVVRLSGTRQLDGHYTVRRSGEKSFAIDLGGAKPDKDETGTWTIVPPEGTGLIFDGVITGFTLEGNGLRIDCANHGLEVGDEVQIAGTADYNDAFLVTRVGNEDFTLDARWQPGTATNLALVTRKRRGLQLDGVDDYVAADGLLPRRPAAGDLFGLTFSAWVYLDEQQQGARLVIGQREPLLRLLINDGKAALGVRYGAGELLQDAKALPRGQWVHLAATMAVDPAAGVSVALYRDGALVAGKALGPAAQLDLATWSPDICIGGLETGLFLKGKVADAQVWTTAREPRAIKDSMYLQLLGREPGLAGYWRMGAVVEEDAGRRSVPSFAAAGRDAVVFGGAYAGARRLERTLRDKNPATRYTNEELFAVTQRATYVERFEFLVASGLNPADVDGRGTPIFACTYWGKSSPAAEERRAFAGGATTFRDLGGGWWEAACRFTVPDDIGAVRLFELSAVTGKWNTLDIRSHAITMISDTVTEARFEDHPALTTLSADYAELEASLDEIAALEAREGALLKEELELRVKLATFNDQAAAEARLAEQQAEVNRLHAIYQEAWATFNRETGNPLNYWCRIQSLKRRGSNTYLWVNLLTRRLEQTAPWFDTEVPNQWFKFVPLGDGRYYIVCKAGNQLLDMTDKSGHPVEGTPDQSAHDNKTWRLYPVNGDPDQGYVLESGASHRLRMTMDLNGYGTFPYGSTSSNSPAYWVIERVPEGWEQVTTAIPEAQTAYHHAHAAWAWANQELENLRRIVADFATNRRNWEQRLAAVMAELRDVQSQLATKNTAFIDSVGNAGQVHLQMPAIAAGRGEVVTRGAILGFARALGRVSALETCEGNVQLSYFDTRGRGRIVNFDATRDSTNAVSDVWSVDGLRTCLNFEHSLRVGTQIGAPREGSIATLQQRVVLGEHWTFECWFALPLPDTSVQAEVLRRWMADNPGTSIPADKLVLPPQQHCFVSDSTTMWAIMAARTASGPCEIGIREQVNDGVTLFRSSGFNLDTLAPGWHHLAVVGDGSTGTFYVDGRWVGSQTALGLNDEARAVATLGNKPYGTEPCGKLAEVRLWQVALSAEEVDANSKLLLTGREPGLVAYFPLDDADATQAVDRTGLNEPAEVRGALRWACGGPPGLTLSDAKVTDDAAASDTLRDGPMASLVSCEYPTFGTDPDTQQKTALMRRMLAFSTGETVDLLAGKRVEALDHQWIGNAQINPTLAGYIEGPPPVPSENLTVDTDYNGASSVEVVASSDVEYSWSREQEAGFGANLSIFYGASSESFQLLPTGTSTSIESTKGGFKGDLSTSYNFLNSSTVAAQSGTLASDRLELRGTPEREARFEQLGRRFIPKNVGYALVTSGTADVFIVRLRRSRRMVSYLVQPNNDIPIDTNIITFMLNPTYTLNGSLDGQCGSFPATERFHRHVPEMRAQYGSSYPASYFRVQEAKQLQDKIAARDKERETYFRNYDSRLVDETSLRRDVKNIKEEMSEEEQKQRRAMIEAKLKDREGKEHALSAFDGWQRKMEALAVQAGKRNIVNTYVWDADGGLRAESQSFASTIEHTVGASFSLEGALGVDMDVSVVKASLALTAQATVSLTQTMSKTARYSSGFGVNVDLSGVEGIGVTDERDNPLVPGEKVNRYRFKTFYLEADPGNWSDFYSRVVDPEWLAGNSEEARALRQAQGSSARPWRVLHRVTYVERPALMGFGRELRALGRASGSVEDATVVTLQQSVVQLQDQNRQLASRVDQILKLLQQANTLGNGAVHEPAQRNGEG